MLSRSAIFGFPLPIFFLLTAVNPTIAAGPPSTLRQHAASRVDLTGGVYDADNKPLPGATVRIYTAGPRVGVSPFCPSCFADCAKFQATDRTGHFRIPALARSLVFRILVVRDGYEPTFVSGVDPLHAPIRVTLKKLASTDANGPRWVVGHVLDPFNQPVVGATIEPFGVKTPDGESFGDREGLDSLVITDEKGEFSFRCPKANDVALATIKARGLATTLAWLPAGSAQPSLVHLSQGVTIIGTVRNPQGRPEPGAVVEVVPTSTNSETFTGWQEIATDSAGRFSLPNVPAGVQYAVCLRMDSLAEARLGAGRRIITAGKDGSVTPLQSLTVKPTGTVTGRVQLADNQAIPPATRVMLGRHGTWDAQQKSLADDGSFTFQGVPPDEDIDIYIIVRGYHMTEATTGYSQLYRGIVFKTPAGQFNKKLLIPLVPDGK